MMTIRTVLDLNGTHLYVEEAGAGLAVVFLHGFALDARMWDDQFRPLAQHFRVIRYDLRGFGRSAVPSDQPYSHVEDLRALLDRLAIEQATLVGLSKGGAVALDFALTYPQRARALALIDTVLGGFSWSAEGSARDHLVWEEAARGGIAAARQSWLSHPVFAPAMRQPAVAARLRQIIDDYSGWHFVHANPEQGITSPAAQRLGELALPLLALVGELDTPDFRQITDLIARRVPHARASVIPGVGHMANMETPEAMTHALLEFIEASTN